MEQNTKQIRELIKEIRIGDRVIGGSYPILIQSMTNTKTQDVDATVTGPYFQQPSLLHFGYIDNP